MILYYQWNQISQQVRIIYTSYVHNFPFNICDLDVHWFSIEFSLICRLNEFDFFYKSKWFVHLMYIIFHWICTILYFQQNPISQQVRTICTSNVHDFPLNFHDLLCLIFYWSFMNFNIQRIQIFFTNLKNLFV